MKYTWCPHCGRPQLFPNVTLARDQYELDKLQKSYDDAFESCRQRGIEHLAEQFTAACSQSTAVFNCWLLKLHRQVASGTQVFETYHDLERLRLRESVDPLLDFETLRPETEIELLGSPDHLDKIHYACLTVNSDGLNSYGDCCVHLAESMIAHRVSCFQGNSAILLHRLHSLATCLRFDWATRGKLCLAALAEHLQPGCGEEDFAGLLTFCGSTQEADRFIEVHVFGSMTARTFRLVRFNVTRHGPDEQVLRRMIEQKLDEVDVEFEVDES